MVNESNIRRASIDIGSNTVLLLAGIIEEGRLTQELANESRVTSLGKDLDTTRVFSDQSMKDTEDALLEYKEILMNLGISNDQIVVTATEASRVAQNAPDFYQKMKALTGFNFEIISGEAEAYYTSLGVVKGTELSGHDITIMDIGGASTELIKVNLEPFSIEKTISLPMGSVRCTDWLAQGEFDLRAQELLKKFDVSEFKTEHLLCVAGSMTSLGAMIKGLKEFDPAGVNGVKIEFEQFLKFSSKIKLASKESIAQKFPFLGKRVHSIVGGALLGEVLGAALGVKTFEISTLGLRYGTLISGGIDERFCR